MVLAPLVLAYDIKMYMGYSLFSLFMVLCHFMYFILLSFYVFNTVFSESVEPDETRKDGVIVSFKGWK